MRKRIVITHLHVVFNTEVEIMDKGGKVSSYEMPGIENDQEEM